MKSAFEAIRALGIADGDGSGDTLVADLRLGEIALKFAMRRCRAC